MVKRVIGENPLKILISDPLSEKGQKFLREQDDVEVTVDTGLSEDELAKVIGDYDGLIVRSQTKVTKKVLSSPGKLRAIARAGVGVDNIDLAAATRAGILVMNTPDANTISTAELSFAHILALSRNVVQACASLKSGEWNRKKYAGRQLAGRVLGVVGYGRVGRAVASRGVAFGMKVIAYDPFFSPSGGQVEFSASLEELLKQADYITIHTPLTAETTGLISEKEIALCKDGAFIVNCARGGIVDEEALRKALESGKLAGAALDVFSSEPPKDNPLIDLDNVVVTPHLGASTSEAQAGVADEACRAILDYLRGTDIRGAVNVGGVDLRLDEYGKRLADGARRIGVLLGTLCSGSVERLQVVLHGKRVQETGAVLGRFALAEMLKPHLEVNVNVVNVGHIARERQIALETIASADGEEREEVMEFSAAFGDEQHSISGGVGHDERPHVWSIDGYRMDMVPEGEMVLLFNDDRPGVIGIVGTLFGRAGMNISDMTIARREERAVMVIKTDAPLPDKLLQELRAAEPILWVDSVSLPSAD